MWLEEEGYANEMRRSSRKGLLFWGRYPFPDGAYILPGTREVYSEGAGCRGSTSSILEVESESRGMGSCDMRNVHRWLQWVTSTCL